VGLINLQPALEGTGTDAKIDGNVGMAAAAGRHEKRLAAVAQTPLGSRFEGRCQATPFTCIEDDFDHEGLLPRRRMAGQPPKSDKYSCGLYRLLTISPSSAAWLSISRNGEKICHALVLD
jgi:hypothetical protein